MITSKRLSSTALGCAALAVGLFFPSSPASALSKNAFTTSFSGSGTNALSEPAAAAVDDSGGPSQGDVYVADPANHRVEKFTPSGEFIWMIGKEVNKTKTEAHATEAEENLCSAASGDECQAGTAGTEAGSFAAPEFLAVDDSSGPSAGDLYVGDRGKSERILGGGSELVGTNVQKLDPEGERVDSWGQGGRLEGAGRFNFGGFGSVAGLHGLAVDLAGDLFVFDGDRYFEIGSAGAFIAASGIAENVPREGYATLISGLAVDSEDALYATGREEVLKFASGSTALEPLAKGGGFALDQLDRDVYAFDAHTEEVLHYSGFCLSVPATEGPNCTTPVDAFGAGHLHEPRGLAVDSATGTVYVADTGAHSIAVFEALPYLPEAAASAHPLTPSTESLSGTADPAGSGEIGSCEFQYGERAGDYELGSLACDPAAPISSKTNVEATPSLEGLEAGTSYHYRLLLKNENGESSSYDQVFTTLPNPPQVTGEFATEVHADTALIHAQINPGGGGEAFHTHYHVQYVTEAHYAEEGFAEAQETESLDAGSAKSAQERTAPLSALTQGTTYRYRVVAENATETTFGATRSFTTYPFIEASDPCPNAHVRQQTSAGLLLDCRAYELVSASNAGGYDVASNIVAGQEPFPGYPEAENRLLYGVHGGAIPGSGSPTGRGLDPYLATRGGEGWSTRYVGIPADGTPSEAPFSSTLLEADAGLSTFAFGGPEICSPCFPDESTGEPVRLPNGELIQGMAGPEEPGPEAEPAGFIAKPLSADGSHLIFGSESRFAPGGNEGAISIYDRDLRTEETKVISNAPTTEDFPEPLPCLTHCESDGIAELAISSDGSHVLIGQLVSQQGKYRYWHLYMEANDSVSSIELAPSATEGVLFAGMSADGSRVFFTSKQELTSADEDHSPDLYLAEEGKPLKLISKGSGSAGNTDECEPAANSAHEHWNSATEGEEPNCGVVAIGGGGGVSANGSVYFLSPEKLAAGGAVCGIPCSGSEPVQNAPNLYLASPEEGYAPRHVTTLESVLSAPHPPKFKHAFKEDFGSFSHATALATEHSSGDLYVLDAGNPTAEPPVPATVEKFNSAGNPVDFTAGPGAGTNRMSGEETPAGSFEPPFAGVVFPTQLAVDQSSGDLYVPDLGHGVVDKFSAGGEYLAQFAVGTPTAVAVDPVNNDLYVSSLFGGQVHIFGPSGSPLGEFAPGGFLSSIAVDSAGTVYVTHLAGFDTGATEAYDSSGQKLRTLDATPGQSVTVDASNGDVYVDEGEGIGRYDSAGNRLETLGASDLSGSLGVTVDPEGNLYATTAGGTEVAVFEAALAPDPRVDNPAVLDSVSEPEARRSADFELTPSGRFAAFPSTLALAGGEEETAGHSEAYRYDASSEALACASCTITGEASSADSSLAPNGLSLTDDGRLFFDSQAQLVAADTDGRKDVYEWEPPGAGNCSEESPTFARTTGDCLALISAGTSPFDSGLLSATANGKDAFFFTRDSLTPQDQNGPTVKVYDAREGGGFPFTLPERQCQASDECHGAGSPAPASPHVRTGTGAEGNAASQPKPRPCRRPRVRRHGHCTKPRRHKGHHRAGHHRRGRK